MRSFLYLFNHQFKCLFNVSENILLKYESYETLETLMMRVFKKVCQS